jgi:hypothetical protein
MEMFKEALLNGDLLVRQPCQVGVQVIFVEGVQSQDITSRMAAGQADGTESGTLIHRACDHLPQRQPTWTVIPQGGGQAGALGQLMQGPDGPQAEALPQMQRARMGGGERGKVLFMFEGQGDGGDFLGGAGERLAGSANGATRYQPGATHRESNAKRK